MPQDDQIESELKSEVAKAKPRDENGQFVGVDKPKPGEPAQGPIDRLFSRNVHYSKSQDDLLDVRVGNPLRRITELLEEIKKQKAFSFTLKGSLGVMGVLLALSVFGIFGGGKILCDRGVQSEMGVIKTLSIYQTESSTTIPVLSNILDFFSPKQTHPRTVLVKDNSTVIDLPFSKNVDFFKYNNISVIVTGNYDSCGQTLTIKEQTAIETFAR